MNETSRRISVRNLVEIILRSGDLFPATPPGRMLDGAQAHRQVQAEAGEDWRSEVYVKATVPGQTLSLTVHGRIDLLNEKSGSIIEIKTTTREPSHIAEDDYPLHWAQAILYAHLYMAEHALPEMEVQLLYLHLGMEKEQRFSRRITAEAAQNLFLSLSSRYLQILEARFLREQKRNDTLQALTFPFADYRPGQRALAGKVFTSIRDGQRLYAQAPTGIGKTMAVLFPALKALALGHTSRLFYLTSRGTARRAPQEALSRLRAQGLCLTSVEITAKEQACPFGACSREDCPYAAGYYDRLQDALDEALTLAGAFTREAISALAEKHTLCPFELSLDLSEQADVVLGDCNYAFDPRAHLRRHFTDRSQATLLIDEAHNLPDRAREMLSSELHLQQLVSLRKGIGKVRRSGALYAAVRGLIGVMQSLFENMGEEKRSALQEIPAELLAAAETLHTEAETLLAMDLPYRDILMETYFELDSFLYCASLFDEKYRLLLSRSGQEAGARLHCLDASAHLAHMYTRTRCQVLFSATLSPAPFYKTLTGGQEEDAFFALPSPFPPENLQILRSPIATRYTRREQTAAALAETLSVFLSTGKGNAIVFFPSYGYLRSIAALLTLPEDIELLVQSSGLSQDDRDSFLSRLSDTSRPAAALAVMGGIFAEGIDLPNNALKKVAVVGVGLPQVGLECELLRAYYEETLGEGFAYAYAYPGMTRVLQAAGRLIRSETDTGSLLLIDERFCQSFYRSLLPDHWQLSGPVYSPGQLSTRLREN